MSDDFFLTEASKLPDNEIRERLKTLYDDGCMSDVERGIYRQIEAQGLESLSKKQRFHYTNNMIPQCVEKCSIKGCIYPTYPGKAYCGMHGIEYGES